MIMIIILTVSLGIDVFMITAVVGLPGVGKTQWIREQIAQTPDKISRYFCPHAEVVPIDATYLQSELPQLEIFQEGEVTPTTTFLEIPWYIDLATIESFLAQIECDRVALLPINLTNCLEKKWADRVIVVESLSLTYGSQLMAQPPQIHRVKLTGEVFDFDSLAVFWFELIQGAYGEIARSKGIFEINSGESVYGDFVAGRINTEFMALNLPPWSEGRPQRLSGLEVVGWNLDPSAIATTLQDCGLSDAHLAYYQHQMKEQESAIA